MPQIVSDITTEEDYKKIEKMTKPPVDKKGFNFSDIDWKKVGDKAIEIVNSMKNRI